MEESINKVEIKGIIGSVHSDPDFYRLSICTHYAYEPADNCPIIETAWHDCIIKKSDLEGTPEKGATCYVTGRLVQRDYSSSQGNIVRTYQIIANIGSVKSNKK